MKNSSTRTGFSRRQFLTGTMIAAGSVAAASQWACSPGGSDASDAQPKTAGVSAEQGSKVEVRSRAAQLNPQNDDFRKNSGVPSNLFTEWQFGSLSLPNRIVKSAAGIHGMWSDGVAGEEPLAYYAALARGGAKMIYMDDMVEMYPSFRAVPEVGKMTDVPDSDLKTFAENLHKEGAYAGYQLASMGIMFSGFVPTGAMFEVSTCVDMTLDEIKLFISETANAAKRLQDCGFDAVEINAAGENVGQTFLSRHRNFRDDQYGAQNMENRTRFLVETVQGIKEACGNDFPVQILINAIEENDGSIGDNSLYTTVAENIEICQLLEEAGADSLHLRLGPSAQHVCEFAGDLYFAGYGIEGSTSFGTQFDFSRHWEGKMISDTSGCGHLINIAAEIKSGVSIPCGCVSYMDPAIAPDMFDEAISEGKIDFILMNRPLNVDFEYIHKLEEGRFDEIAPCCRCLHCHWDMDRQGDITMSCRTNATTHRAFRDPMPEGFEPTTAVSPKKVMVIGGGPAGMEAARIAAARGHEVSLYEKGSLTGGLLDFAYLTKGGHENLDILKDYLTQQLALEGVNVVTGQEVDTAFIEQESPEAVILAVGGLRDSLGIESTSGTQVLPIENALDPELPDDIVVVGSNAQAIDIVMYLLAQGKNVQIVTPSPKEAVGDGHSAWVKTFTLPMIKALGTRIWPNAEIMEVGDGEVRIKQETGSEQVLACKVVIEAMDMLPNTALVEGLDIETYTVGDCDNPYNIANAIATANLAARAV